jgi:flagellar basal-body rod protein FlgC
MKIGPKFSAFDIIAKGLRIQKKRMDLVAENLANAETTKTASGGPYKRKFLTVHAGDFKIPVPKLGEVQTIKLETTSNEHISIPAQPEAETERQEMSMQTRVDNTPGELVYMPDNPDADENGYVQMPNVNVINEMVDMIAATRGFEANVTAFNGAKQIAKDSLEI